MSELDLCDTLGILLDPDVNKLTITAEVEDSIKQLYGALEEINSQKKVFGTLNPDIWLEFIPWHSLN